MYNVLRSLLHLQGYILTMKEGYGFIRCTDRDARMFFHFSEMLDCDREIKLQQEIEFTVVPVISVFKSLNRFFFSNF